MIAQIDAQLSESGDVWIDGVKYRKINPVSYSEKLSGNSAASASAISGIGGSITVEPLEARIIGKVGGGLGVGAEVEGSIERDPNTGKKKVELSGANGANADVAFRGAIGASWGNSTRTDVEKGKLDLSVIGADAGVTIGSVSERGIVLEDCDHLTAEDSKRLALWYGCTLVDKKRKSEVSGRLVMESVSPDV